MEGPLCKWTNVIEGWQYRWFVLDEAAGILVYYTSKEKMTKGERRGCVRLKGAVIGIDDEDDSTFTITVDQKMFHFQARDASEREMWIRALEATVQRVSGYYKLRGKKWTSSLPSVTKSCQDFERRIAEADGYLQLFLDNIKDLEEITAQTKIGEEREQFQKIVEIASAMSESVKHAIVVLQLTKNQLNPSDNIFPPLAINNITIAKCGAEQQVKLGSVDDISVPTESSVKISVPSRMAMRHMRSYSSSDEEESEEIYFDTVESSTISDMKSASTSAPVIGDKLIAGLMAHPSVNSPRHHKLSGDVTDADNDSIDYDAVYEDDEEDELENVQEHGSIIMHMLSQLSVGMDLTKIVLPTFILERRSLLEMFADFFAHPDLFIHVADEKSPEDRMIAVVKWYLSSFHAGRKSSVAKKPYNPILGETFHCLWDIPDVQNNEQSDIVKDGPYPGARADQLTFIAEQVSHHPPVSAFFAEYPNKRISLNGHIWTKSKFLGLSIAVHNVGQARLSLSDVSEDYILTFPSGYGRSILGTPWIELGGKCSIVCQKTGYSANIEFLTKPFYGGKAHLIKGEVFRPHNKNAFATIRGHWNGQMFIRIGSMPEQVFLDVHQVPVVKKVVRSIREQGDYESRKLWRQVTAALKQKNVHLATKSKHFLEQRQRNEAKERAAANLDWHPTYFVHAPPDENWVYSRRKE